MKNTPPELPAEKHRILIVDDHAILRDGLRRLLESEPDLCVCGEAKDARTACEAVSQLKPELAIVDISMPGPDGIELVKELHPRFPDSKFLMLSMHDESIYAERALRAGAMGYIMKQAPTELLLTAIRALLDNQRYLSPPMASHFVNAFVSKKKTMNNDLGKLSDRELEIIRLVGKGFTTSEVAKELGISGKTVESHRGNLRRKLNFKNGSELLRYAIAHSRD